MHFSDDMLQVTLNIYSYENVAYHVLHQRIAQYSFRTLSSWFNHRTHLYRYVDHMIHTCTALALAVTFYIYILYMYCLSD